MIARFRRPPRPTRRALVVLPNGFTEENTPVSLSFVGRLYGEGDALLVAKAYQDATGFHERYPPLFDVAPDAGS